MDDWSEFLAAITVFFAAHMIPTRPAIKKGITRMIGARAFTLLYSALSIGLLVWLIIAARRVPGDWLWYDSLPHHIVTQGAMLLACILVAYAVVSPSPLSFGTPTAPFKPAQPGLAGVTRHPILLSLALWAFGHIVSNGQLALVIMFGMLGAFALIGMVIIDRRNRRLWGEEAWGKAAAATSLIPLSALISGRWKPQSWPRLAPLAAGIGIWLLLVLFHPIVIGLHAIDIGR